MKYDRTITISVGSSRKAVNWHPQTLTLSELYARLQAPIRGSETLAAYFTYPKQKQNELKDVGGFVGGVLFGNRRKGNAVAGRDLLTLDLDHLPADSTEQLLRRLEELDCGYCVYSTRKHQPSAPRLRVLVPLDRTVTADEYEPCARKMAERIGMAYADPTTFEASRLMYWPSCCADSEYLCRFADKPLAQADQLLTSYTDWRDMAQWPQVPGVSVVPRQQAAKQGDPLAKSGVVGAFCRVYDIHRALLELLPGYYTPVEGEQNRYTYTKGSTAGGAVVYDEGRFLFSHHATDPCCGKLVNAFDLVRLHQFEHLDDEAKPDTPANRLPSYLEMCRFASANPLVTKEMAQTRYASAVLDFTETQAQEQQSNWMGKLDMNGQGVPERTLKNFKLILTCDPNLAGKAKLNLFTGRIDVCGELPWERPGNNPLWGDMDTTNLRIYLEPICGKATKNDVSDAVEACAGYHAYHPVREYLGALRWDGNPRLDRLLIDYLGAQDTVYTRAVTRKAFVAAVARVMTPGVKYDNMLILIGPQGRYKSSLLAKMGGEWFSDSLKTFDGKEAMETIQGTWINEIGEMQAMQRSEVNAVKAFLSKQADYYRAAYGRHVSERPRQCVFFGTSNPRDVLTDTTGGRRFWPVDIDRQARIKDVFREINDERDQIWAEAVTRWRLGEPLFLPASMEEQARAEQESHRERHPWEGEIEQFLNRKIPGNWDDWTMEQRRMFFSGNAQVEEALVERRRVCAAEIWCEMLGKAKAEMRKREAREINQILEATPGWESVSTPRNAGKPYGNQRCFQRKIQH